MRLSIIIVNYNTSIYTLDAIAAICLEKQSDDFEIIVVDNASTDNSVAEINESEFLNRITFIILEENVGFGIGNNIAAKQAKGEYLLLLNPDTVILNHAIDKLMSFAERNPDAGIWGGRTVFADHSLNTYSCWKRQTPWSLLSQAVGLSSLFRNSSFFNPEGIGGWDRNGIRQVDIVSGCFFLIRHELWEKLKGFDSDFFMYGEEADLCLRAKNEFSANPMVTSEATIIHYGGASEKIRSDQLVKLLKAKILLIRKHFDSHTKMAGVLLLACWPLSRYIAHFVLFKCGRTDSDLSADVWGEVWRRRGEWLV